MHPSSPVGRNVSLLHAFIAASRFANTVGDLNMVDVQLTTCLWEVLQKVPGTEVIKYITALHDPAGEPTVTHPEELPPFSAKHRYTNLSLISRARLPHPLQLRGNN